MHMNEVFIPCWVILDGKNKPFDSWIKPEEVEKINAVGGLKNAVYYQLRETVDKPIPLAFQQGISMTEDIWVVLAIGEGFDTTKS